MKNLLAYTPEPFDNLEAEILTQELLSGEGELDNEARRGRARRPRSASGRRRGGPSPQRRPRYPQPPWRPGNEPSGGTAGSGAATASADRSLVERDERGSEYIRWAQDSLNRIFALRLPLDGIMSRETRSAVRMLQERHGLPVTGLIGPDTEQVLRSDLSPKVALR